MAVAPYTSRRTLLRALPAVAVVSAAPSIALADTPIAKIKRRLDAANLQCEAAHEDDQIDRLATEAARIENELGHAPIRSKADAFILLRSAARQADVGELTDGIGAAALIERAVKWLEAN